MKVGAETVIWGSKIDSLPYALDLLAAYGCKGVEFSQRVETLGDAEDIRELLRERDLTLVGLSGGTLVERIEFCKDILRPEYLYVEEWEDRASELAIEAGFTLALHPHIFKPVHRAADADDLLRRYPRLKFLPDTAHLTIAGDQPAHVIARWSDRISAIHLKDWTPMYGRSAHRYARGFVELGRGRVNFEMLFNRLRTIKYDGWLLFEQGSADTTPENLVSHATRWIARQQLPLKHEIGPGKSRPEPPPKRLPTVPPIRKGFTAAKEKLFLEVVLKSTTESPRNCYSVLTTALGELLDAKLIILCVCSPTANVLGVVGVHPASTNLHSQHLQFAGSLSAVALARQAVTEFDLTADMPAAAYGEPEARFGFQDLVRRMGVKKMFSVPVINPHSPHQARFVINICPKNGARYDRGELERLSGLITQAADAALDERCAIAAADANIRAGDCQQVVAFLRSLRELFSDTLSSDHLTIFLVNDAGTQLEAVESSGISWSASPAERFYRKDEIDPLCEVWRTKEAKILTNAAPIRAALKSWEGKDAKAGAVLCAPMLDAGGEVVGVVRCRTKRGAPRMDMFSEDDLAVFDAICQASIPHLEVLLSKDRRAKALRRLTHELHNPLVAIGGAADRMKSELRRRRGSAENYFSKDYISDVTSWVGLMRGLLGNADLFRFSGEKPHLELRRVELYGDVFMPAVNQVQMLLHDRDFSSNRIHIPKFVEIPPLWIDKNRFSQVVFNLLSNAIKYAHDDPTRFRIVVASREDYDNYVIDFADWGTGVPAEMREAIFLEGVRSKQAEHINISGDGLGLWVTRHVIHAHDAKIEVTNCSEPTVFTISLPKSLSHKRE